MKKFKKKNANGSTKIPERNLVRLANYKLGELGEGDKHKYTLLNSRYKHFCHFFLSFWWMLKTGWMTLTTSLIKNKGGGGGKKQGSTVDGRPKGGNKKKHKKKQTNKKNKEEE